MFTIPNIIDIEGPDVSHFGIYIVFEYAMLAFINGTGYVTVNGQEVNLKSGSTAPKI
jgi:hypothetical protein